MKLLYCSNTFYEIIFPGHLTQVLWAGSEKLGVGVAKNGYHTFVVCNYNPPGNYKGEYAENVPPIGLVLIDTISCRNWLD